MNISHQLKTTSRATLLKRAIITTTCIWALGTGVSHAALDPVGCALPLDRMDWDEVGYTPGALNGESFTVTSYPAPYGLDATFNYDLSGDTSHLTTYAGLVPPVDNVTIFGNGGGLGDGGEQLLLLADPPTPSSSITVAQSFSQPLDDVRFSIYDIDNSALGTGTARRDQMAVRGWIGGCGTGTPVTPTLEADSATPCFAIAGNVATALATACASNANQNFGTLNVSFPSAVDCVEVDYNEAMTTGNPSVRGVSITDISYCPSRQVVGGAKSVAAGPSVDGNGLVTVTYNLVVENYGNVDLHDIQLGEILDPEFGSPVSGTPSVFDTYNISSLVVSGTSGDTNGNSAVNLVLNTGFDGSSDSNIFDVAAGGYLEPGESITVAMTVQFKPSDFGDSFENQTYASGDSVDDDDGDTSDGPNDPSDNGSDPDADGDGFPDEHCTAASNPAVADSAGIGNGACTDNNDPTVININSLPVTLSRFNSRAVGEKIKFKWKTATETFTVGFHLWGQVNGKWTQLNNKLIPSATTDALTPTNYKKSVDVSDLDSPVEVVGISSVDTNGTEHFMGPFQTGTKYGSESVTPSIPWNLIRKKHDRRMRRLGYVKFKDRWVRSAAKKAKMAAVQAGTSVVDAHITESGVYRVTHAELVAAGVDLTDVPAKAVAVTFKGKPVARRVGGQKPMGANSWIDFYAQAVSASDALYTAQNVYRISVDYSLVREASSVQRADLNAIPRPSVAVARSNEQNMYSFVSPLDDPWFAAQVLAIGSPAEHVTNLELGPVVQGTQAQLRLQLAGITDWPGTDPDHHIQVFLNEMAQPLIDARDDGLKAWNLQATVPAGVLRPGINTVRVVVVGDTGFNFDAVAVDTVEIEYLTPAVALSGSHTVTAQMRDFVVNGFDTDEVVAYAYHDGNLASLQLHTQANGSGFDAHVPSVATGEATYVVAKPSALKTVDGLFVADLDSALLDEAADYLIVAHPSFVDGLEEYIQVRRDEGYAVRVVDTETIYANFGHGMPVPSAIRNFLFQADSAFSYGHVLLVGSASSDPHNHTGSGSVDFVPTPYTHSMEMITYTPSDSMLVDFDADDRADKAIGRWPVRTVEELATMVRKTLGFASTMAAERSAVVVAGANEPGLDFVGQADRLQALLQSVGFNGTSEAWTDVTRVDVDDFAGHANGQNVAARASLKDALDQGSTLTVFAGHGSPSAWTYESLLDHSSASSLGNADRPTLVMPLACYTTYYVSPGTDTLANTLLTANDNGAVAMHGAAVLSFFAHNEAMAKSVLQGMLQRDLTLGEAVKEAAAQLPDDYRDIFVNWSVLGDPTLRVAQ